MQGTAEDHRRAMIGDPRYNFWLYDSIDGFDLTHPPTPTTPTVETAVTIKTVKEPITIDPKMSALVIIDMQNFFLSPALGRSLQSKGIEAQNQLLKYAIPAARKAGIRIVWLNWGLTDDDLRTMPPAPNRAFGFETVKADDFEYHLTDSKAKHGLESPSRQLEATGKNSGLYRGLGNDLGQVTLETGQIVEAGRMLMRDQWNTQLMPELAKAYDEGLQCHPPDVWIHKKRMSGVWGPSNPCRKFLDAEGIRTLFFAGVNTDQCVGGSMADAFSEGYDCILLSDGAGTSSPAACQDAYEFNAAGVYGFCTRCRDLWEAVEG